MDAALSRPAVVIDNGTGYTKIGFAGNVEPCFIIPTVVVVNESFSKDSGGSFNGNWLAQHSACVKDDLDFFIGDEALTKCHSSSVYNLSYPILHGQCEMTGVVIDVGDGATNIVPVAEGYVIGGSIKSFPIAGRDVTLFVQQLLQERGEHIPPEESFEVAKKVKEMHCYTSLDILKEYGKHDREPSKYIKEWTGVKPKTGALYFCDVGYERFLGPEIFFNPEIYNSDFTTSLPAVVDSCIQSSAIDTRRTLYKIIVLSGGTTMIKDFHKRLQRDLKKIVDARSDARHGGDVKACHTKAEYEEHGGSICRTNPIFKGMY